MISVRSEQKTDELEEPEVLEFITSGCYAKNEKGCTISYDESELTGMDGTKTVLSVDNGLITVERHGYVTSQMIFEKGQKHLSLYDTPVGSLVVGINASEVDMKFDECGGRLFIGYSVEVDNVTATRNRFTVNVSGPDRPVKNTIFE